MSNADIIKEESDFRVSLILDEYPEEPYNDGQSPMIRIYGTRAFGATAEHVQVGGMRPTDRDDRIEEAIVHFWQLPNRRELVEKYLRAFHGATAVKWYGPNQATDNTYLTYDTPEWAEAIGYDDKIAPRDSYDGSKAVNMDEYISYLEGDVYGYVVERKVTEETITRALDGTEIGHDTTDAWEEVDSCWGYYGHEYAEERALEALAEAIKGA